MPDTSLTTVVATVGAEPSRLDESRRRGHGRLWETAGVDLSVLDWGTCERVVAGRLGLNVEHAGGGPVTVVALHGFTSGTFTWAGIAPTLAERARVVAWDRPPFGSSDRPDPSSDPGPYGLDGQVDQLVEVLAWAGADASRTVLVGHSAGTVVAAEAVRRGAVHPAAVVLISPAMGAGPPAAVRRLAALPGASSVAVPLLQLGLRGAAPVIRRFAGHETPLMAATAEASGRALRTPGTAAGLWHQTSSFEAIDPTRDGPLGVPTFVVSGRDDRIVRLEDQYATAGRLAARHAVLDGVGHAPHEQVPEAVLTVLGEVLDGVEGP